MSKRKLFDQAIDQLEEDQLNMLSELMGTKDGEILTTLFNELESEDANYMFGYISGLISGYMVGKKKWKKKSQ